MWGLGLKSQVFLQDQVVLTYKPPFQSHRPNYDSLNSPHEHCGSLAQRMEPYSRHLESQRVTRLCSPLNVRPRWQGCGDLN